jgi:DNA-binding helix-hairpin-helix protein with protein kinase domain
VKFKRNESRAAAVRWIGIAASIVLALIWHPGALVGVMAVPFIALILRGGVPDEARDVRARLSSARERLDAVVRQIERERTTSPVPSLATRARELYQHSRDFPQRRAERLRDLERSRHERQLRRFLDQFEVKDARLKGFGPGLFVTLISNGIETADDVALERLEGIRGIGPKRISVLLDWRHQIEAKFKFNQADPADVRERARVECELQLEHAKDVGELRRLAEQIMAHARPLRQRIVALTGELGQAQRELALARATAAVLGKAA